MNNPTLCDIIISMKTSQTGALPNEKYIYILLTRTGGIVPAVILAASGARFNHVAVSFSPYLEKIYSFARLHRSSPLVGGPVCECLDRYTTGNKRIVPAVLFALRVSGSEYEKAYSAVKKIFSDREYIYNLLSVVSMPLSGGFRMYKAYSCSEFAANILRKAGLDAGIPTWQCTPDDIFRLLLRLPRTRSTPIYSGDIRGCLGRRCRDIEIMSAFSEPELYRLISETLYFAFETARRLICRAT